MARVLGTSPVSTTADRDPLAVRIEHWRHAALHDVVDPMSEHVVMTFLGTMQRFERRSGRTYVSGTARKGGLTVIPAGSSSRWDIYGELDVVQLYLPPASLHELADETGYPGTVELVEVTAQLDPTAAHLLTMAAAKVTAIEPAEVLFREHLIGAISAHLLAHNTNASRKSERAIGGLSPSVLRRALERLQSSDDDDVSLAALAREANLSRFHFCRAFKQSTGLAPHEWLRQRRMETAMTMLRDPSVSVVTIAEAVGYSTQTAFGAAFKRVTGLTPTEWRRKAY
jgi:AraC family transcriptional regulator